METLEERKSAPFAAIIKDGHQKTPWDNISKWEHLKIEK